MTLRGQEAIDEWAKRKLRRKARYQAIGVVILIAVVIGSAIWYTT